LPYFLYWFF